MTGDTVLLITASYDDVADDVAQALTSRGAKWFRFNTDLFPSEVRGFINNDGASGISTPAGSLTHQDVKSVWYRRQVAPILPDDLDPGVIDFCQRESRAFIDGFLHSLPTNHWVSDP